MAAGFKVWDLLHNDYLTHNGHIAGAAIASVVMVGGAVAYRSLAPKVSESTQNDQLFVPPEKFGVQNFFEMVGEFVQGVAKDVIGHHYGKYLPLLIFIFLWTWVNNLMGLIPGLGSSTDSMNTTLAMALVTFLYYNYQGFKSHGFKYLEHFTGHLHGTLLLLLGPVMFVIETVSHMIRPMTLGIRLRTNIYADHTVFGIISGLVQDLGKTLEASLGAFGAAIGYVLSSLVPVPVVFLGLLVCTIQAFVFTLLTTIYVGMATAHEEH
jgi:F-type H+-transporting ATPase subunit a